MIIKKCSIVSLIFSLIVSLVAPAGAVFAIDGGILERDDSEIVPLNTENKPHLDGESIEQNNNDSDFIPLQTSNDPAAVGGNSEREISTGGVIITEVRTQYASAREELIELFNNSDEDLDVSGWCVNYGATAIKSVCLRSDEVGLVGLILPARSYVVLVSNSFSANNPTFGYDFTFPYGLSNDDGSVILTNRSGEEIDSVRWGSSSERAKPHGKGYVLRRVQDSLGVFVDSDNDTSDFSAVEPRETYEYGSLIEIIDMCVNIEGYQSIVPEGYIRHESNGSCADVSLPVRTCEGIIISEIAANVTDQFIELHNQTNESLDLGGCILQTNNSKAVTYILPDITLEAGGHEAVYIEDTDLKLTKTTTGVVYLLSADGKLETDSVKYSNLAKETSWALVGGNWEQTYKITAGGANQYAKYIPCDVGYWRNEETGRCNKIIEPATLVDCGEGRERNPATGRCRNIPVESMIAPCKEGQYRSEETNRCRSIASAVSSLKACADDQFRNPETNRCKKIASSDDLADCGEGRERNPETNRCRNVLAASTSTLPFAPEGVTETASSMIGWWALGGVSLVAIGYAGWQWRWEVSRLVEKTRRSFATRGK